MRTPLTLRELRKAIDMMADFNGAEILDFELVTYGPDGKPRLMKTELSIAEPGERLIGLGLDGFVLRKDLP